MSALPPTGASGYVKYRHAVEFHRVASVQEPVLGQGNDTNMYQVVNLEQPVTNYPISHALGDGRALPDLYTTPDTFSGLRAYPNVLPNAALQPSGSAPYASTLCGPPVEAVWVPIVVMHGLQEVFTVRN